MTKKILVACEYSGVVREAFAKRGWDAWSCDLLPTDQPSDKHIQGDCLEAIASQKWDMIIAHPPCTYLTVSNSKNWAGGYTRILVSINFDEIILGLGFSFSYPQFLLVLDSYPIRQY